jgi:hypothetical protein
MQTPNADERALAHLAIRGAMTAGAARTTPAGVA